VGEILWVFILVLQVEFVVDPDIIVKVLFLVT
jgi:hypothetical protein